jgi:hypothetical protein
MKLRQIDDDAEDLLFAEESVELFFHLDSE